MASQAYRAALFFVLSTILPVTLPVVAGEARYSTTGHKGHSVSRRGVENIYHSQRRLPNGVSIFNRHNHARHVPVHKGGKRKHARNATHNGQRGSKSRREAREKTHAKGGGNWRESTKQPTRGHKHHEKPLSVYPTTGHKGHSVSRRGVENIYHSQRRLPNGVSIFNRHNHARHVPVHKGGKRKHARNATRNGQRGWKSHRETKDKKHAKGSGSWRESAKQPRRGHKHHEKPLSVYAAGVAVSTPSDEYVYAQDRGDEDCHYLVERGYDRTGRRVLVEWSLCFDDQGTAYVPDEGRRILARY